MTTLFRPVGLRELELIINSGFKEFPPRLPEQPIFYPVLNIDYAIQIASEWNVKYGSGNAGFVTEFEMDDSYIEQFKVQTVGASMHKELWIPAEKLTEFNTNIIGCIKVVKAFYGEKYTGIIPNEGQLKGKTASKQIIQLYRLLVTDIE